MTVIERVSLADLAEGIRCQDPAHRSYSRDRAFERCPMAEHLVATGAGVDYMGIEACVGSAVDAAACAIIAGEQPNVESLLGDAIAAMADPAMLFDTGEAIDKASRLVELFEREVLPTYARHGGVYATQLELHYQVAGAERHAHLDCVLGDGSVIDWKTSEKRLPERAVDRSVQLTEYAYALHAVYGQLPPSVGLDGLIFANPPADVRAWNPEATKPWWDRQRSIRTPAQLEAFVADCERREQLRRWCAETGIYPTTGRSQMDYVCNRCPVRPVCPSWAGFDTGLAATAALS